MYSIIIPTYNASHHIISAIKSILDQTIKDFEIIIVDDGSTDDTKITLNTIQDPRIKYFYQKNKGVSSARNTGIKNSKGDFICFLDVDDLWLPNHLEEIDGMRIKYPECKVFLTGYKIRMIDGTYVERNAKISTTILSNNVYKNIWDWGYFVHTNSIVCEKKCFFEVGNFEEGIKNGEDDDMWYRLFAHNKVAISPKITSVYIRENSTATSKKTMENNWCFLKKVPEILNSKKVPFERKKYLKKLIEQHKLSKVRFMLLNNDKKMAWKEFKKINFCKLKKTKYITTIVAFIIPQKVLAKNINNRDKRYYKTK